MGLFDNIGGGNGLLPFAGRWNDATSSLAGLPPWAGDALAAIQAGGSPYTPRFFSGGAPQNMPAQSPTNAQGSGILPNAQEPPPAEAMAQTAPGGQQQGGMWGNLLSGISNGIASHPQTLMAMAGGFGQPGWGFGNAMRAAGPASQQDLQQQQLLQSQAATRYSLLKAGVSPELAHAASLDPKVLAQVAPGTIGTDSKIVPFGGALINKQGQVVYSGNQGDMLLDPGTIKVMAEQARSGDTSVFQNLGRGAQGAQNIVALRKEIAQQNAEQGASGSDQAMRNAEFFGVKSGQRTLGTKQANIEMAATEFKQVLPIVQQASNAVDRTRFPDLNKIIQAYEEKTGDPNIVKFGGGVNTLVNLYARAISPGGVATVSDKDHARLILNRAWSQGQFNAAVGMMQQEIDAALNSPEKVRDSMRARFGISPPAASGGVPAAPAASQAADPLGIR